MSDELSFYMQRYERVDIGVESRQRQNEPPRVKMVER